jgi:lipoprotein-anchoring transpeptidase ErfK/SrfK
MQQIDVSMLWPTRSMARHLRMLPFVASVLWLTVTMWLTVSVAPAQHGTPMELRHMDPTIEDAAPGREPEPEAAVVAEAYRRQPVFYRTSEPPGTIIIDTSRRFLYLIASNNTALRYGVGVGRDGFQWNGLLKVTRKAEWPDWTPPPEMIERQPYLPRFMAGGPGNPMGARALYLGNTFIAFTAPTRPRPSGMRFHRAASGS